MWGTTANQAMGRLSEGVSPSSFASSQGSVGGGLHLSTCPKLSAGLEVVGVEVSMPFNDQEMHS